MNEAYDPESHEHYYDEYEQPPTIPHRGGMILALGIVGLVVGCFVVSAIAWVLGNQDLQAMNDGRMDPAGRDLTQVGRILGMVFTILTLIGIGIFVMVILLGVLASG